MERLIILMLLNRSVEIYVGLTQSYINTCEALWNEQRVFVNDIIGKVVGLPNQVINLDNPDIEVITNRILEGITNRVKIKQYLSDYKSTIAKSRKQLLSILPATVHNKN